MTSGHPGERPARVENRRELATRALAMGDRALATGPGAGRHPVQRNVVLALPGS